MSQEQIAKALYVADHWRNPHADELWATDPDFAKEPYMLMAAAMLPLFAEAQAEAWDDCADLVGDDDAAEMKTRNPYRLTA